MIAKASARVRLWPLLLLRKASSQPIWIIDLALPGSRFPLLSSKRLPLHSKNFPSQQTTAHQRLIKHKHNGSKTLLPLLAFAYNIAGHNWNSSNNPAAQEGKAPLNGDEMVPCLHWTMADAGPQQICPFTYILHPNLPTPSGVSEYYTWTWYYRTCSRIGNKHTVRPLFSMHIKLKRSLDGPLKRKAFEGFVLIKGMIVYYHNLSHTSLSPSAHSMHKMPRSNQWPSSEPTSLWCKLQTIGSSIC